MKTRYRNVAFLMELMVNILVFSISCAVLVGLFGKAGQISKQTSAETGAKTRVQSLVEVLRAHGPEGLPAEGEAGRYTVYYDGDWEPVPANDAGCRYLVRLTVQDEATAAGTLQKVQAGAFTREETPLYALETAHYTPSAGEVSP